MQEQPPLFDAKPACVWSRSYSSGKGFWRLARVVFLGSMAAGFVMTLGMTTVLESVIDSRIHELQASDGQESLRSARLETELQLAQAELEELRLQMLGSTLRSTRDKRRLQVAHESCARTWTLSHASAQGVTTQIVTVPAASKRRLAGEVSPERDRQGEQEAGRQIEQAQYAGAQVELLDVEK